MNTQFLSIHSPADTDALRMAADVLRRGGLCAIPTETVYGLAADALNADAVRRIFAAKGRPQDNPLIVHIASLPELSAAARNVPDAAFRLAEAFWPGPLTMVLPKAACIPDAVSCGLDTVAVRMPAHPIARAVIQAAGVPLAAPSANTSGKPSPTTAAHVRADLDGKIDMIVDGGQSEVGVESTVVTLCTPTPRLLRPGGVTLAQLRSVLGSVEVDKAVLGTLSPDEQPASPGMKYKHYSPDADVFLYKGTAAQMAAFAKRYPTDTTAIVCFDGEESLFAGYTVFTIGAADDGAAHAHAVFDVLRKADALGFQTVLTHCPGSDGVDLAVLNRLLRAAAFRVIDRE